jgi:hypothetical protein
MKSSIIVNSIDYMTTKIIIIFRCEEHLYKRLRRSVGWSVDPLVHPSVPTMQLHGKLVTSQLLREEEEEEKNWLRRDSFTPRDQVIPLFS